MKKSFFVPIICKMATMKYLISLLAGTCVYVLLSITCGENGIWAQRQMEEQKRIISAHTQEIQKINDDLHLEKAAMRSDMDVIAAYARKLDYVFPGEKLVKIKGLGVSDSLMYEMGTVLKSHPVAFVGEWFSKGAATAVGLLVFFVLALFDVSYGVKKTFSRKSQRDFETIEGIPVYDVAQV